MTIRVVVGCGDQFRASAVGCIKMGRGCSLWILPGSTGNCGMKEKNELNKQTGANEQIKIEIVV